MALNLDKLERQLDEALEKETLESLKQFIFDERKKDKQLIEIGSRVVDINGNIGVVLHIHDIHNIEVEYDKGGSGLYCDDIECTHYDRLRLVQKTENDAIKFGEWILSNNWTTGDRIGRHLFKSTVWYDKYSSSGKPYTTEELYELYLKNKT